MVYESEGEEAAAPDHDPADMSDSDDDDVQMLTEEEFIQAVAARKAAKEDREAVENQLQEMRVNADELRAEAVRIKAMAASMRMPIPVHMERVNWEISRNEEPINWCQVYVSCLLFWLKNRD